MDLEYLLGCVFFASWLGSLMWVTFTTPLALCLLPNRWALAYLAILWGTLVIPLDRPISRWGRHFMTLSIKAAYRRHKVQVTYEDKAALTPGRPYIVGYEPHSVLPFALQTVFCDLAPARAPGFKDMRILATTAGFYVPLLRHIWWWLGTRSADRKSMSAILAAGGTAVLIPGGVQECGYLEQGKETVFLKSRKGFVRMALQHGAPLVPVFCFGQTRMLSFRHLGPPLMPRAAVKNFARMIGVLPMVVWGWLQVM
ncbi:hypothetical protein WJX73_006358 [Symbiochloris irregularis]|uniref:Acyltransferase n=1 Tax=Symbiochloris irregularis TaxID=706552 RepID=A0AAW1NSG3_9CHLO